MCAKILVSLQVDSSLISSDSAPRSSDDDLLQSQLESTHYLRISLSTCISEHYLSLTRLRAAVRYKILSHCLQTVPSLTPWRIRNTLENPDSPGRKKQRIPFHVCRLYVKSGHRPTQSGYRHTHPNCRILISSLPPL